MSETASIVNNKRIINAWAMFDWANSSYALVIAAAIFPVYFLNVTDDFVPFFGGQISNSALFAYAVSAAYVLIAIFSPALSGIADYGGKKMFFLRFFTTLGAIACMLMFFFQHSGQVYFGTWTFVFATIGFAGALVFYNAYLPEITTPDRYDHVSARGFAYGYIGSVLLLVFNLLMIQNPGWFGLADAGAASRISFLIVGLWWIGFAQIPFRRLPKDEPMGSTKGLVKKGINELKKVWGEAKHQPNIKRFLGSFFFYIAGAQTVLFLATAFADKVLALSSGELIIIIILVQFVGILGAYLFAQVSKWKGNKVSIFSMLIIWIVICLLAYFVQTKMAFYGVAALVGMVMGGIQSMSRSTYSKLLPENAHDTTSYFSFYDVLEKVAIVIGTFGFGLIETLTGDIRNSVLVLTAFFVIGLLFLARVKVQPAVVRH